MLIDEDQNPPPTLEESYSTAIGSSNLKHDPDRPGAVQMIIAAGINPHTLGKALMRLRTEWDASAKPAAPTEEQVKAFARTLLVTHRPLYVISQERMEDHMNHMSRAWCLEDARRQAQEWHEIELGRLLQRLKTLPFVRDELVRWAAEQGIEGAPHVVAAALLWWLGHRCPACKGVQKKIVEGTGRTSSKDCSKCRGTGETRIPHGFLGRKVIGYMSHSLSNARGHLKATKWRHHG